LPVGEALSGIAGSRSCWRGLCLWPFIATTPQAHPPSPGPAPPRADPVLPGGPAERELHRYILPLLYQRAFPNYFWECFWREMYRSRHPRRPLPVRSSPVWEPPGHQIGVRVAMEQKTGARVMSCCAPISSANSAPETASDPCSPPFPVITMTHLPPKRRSGLRTMSRTRRDSCEKSHSHRNRCSSSLL